MEEMNIKEYFNILKKKWIFIAIPTAILVFLVFIYNVNFKVPKYTSYTTLVLTQSQREENTMITQNDIMINQKLVYTYSELVKSKLVLNKVINNLHLKLNEKDLSRMVNVTSIENTEILKISVENKDKKLASVVANEIADVFSKEVVEIYDINNVSIIDKATPSKIVSNNTLVRDLALTIIAGILLSSGVIFVIYYFDDTVKFTEDIEEELGLPVIGKIIKQRNDKKEVMDTELIVNKYPKSLVSEGIKSLRTNLMFSNIDTEIKSILVTSSIPSEGKSFVSANLATAFAQTGKRVLLVDCDMRKGRQHKIFKVSNRKGFSDLIVDNISNFEDYIKPTDVRKLYVLPCGTIPPNPSELLNSEKNKKLLKLMKDNFDLVIFDGVPCNGLPDSIIMSNLVDKTVIVSAENVTPKELLNNTKKSLENVNSNIGGLIINKVNTTGSKYYGKYYSYYGDEK